MRQKLDYLDIYLEGYLLGATRGLSTRQAHATQGALIQLTISAFCNVYNSKLNTDELTDNILQY